MDVTRRNLFTRSAWQLIVVAMVSSGCSSVTVSVAHNPLYRGDIHDSTIAATATSKSGIARIDIDVTVGEAIPCSELSGPDLPSLVPCRDHAFTVTRTCVFAGQPTSASCAFTRNLGPRSYITYQAIATSRTGNVRESNFVTYAGGPPPVEWVSWWDLLPFPTIEVAAWEPLQPIWWEVERPQEWGVSQDVRIDIGFHRDPDYGVDQNGFWNDLHNIVTRSYFNNTQSFAQDYTLWRSKFTLWRGIATVDAEPPRSGSTNCTRSVRGSTAYTDADVIIHRSQFRDCADIAPGGNGTVTGGRTDSAEIFMHESGHFLFALGDEYCCNGGHFSSAVPPNVFSTKAVCETNATGLGVATSLCIRQANATASVVFWRIDDGTPEIMEDERVTGEDWNDSSYKAFTNRIARCVTGQCY